MPNDEIDPLQPTTPPTPPEPPTPPTPDVPPLDPVAPPGWGEPPIPDGHIAMAAGDLLPSFPVTTRPGIPKAAIIGALIAVSVAVAAVAVVKSTGSDGTADMATVVPADALGFVRISVEPSGAQRADLRRLLGKLSAARRAQVISSFDEALANLIDIPGGDFARDVRPWLGAQIAVAVHATGGRPAPVGVFGVRDEALARAFYAKHAKAGGPVLEIEGGVGYVSDSTSRIDTFRAAATKAPLSDNAAYNKELAAAGGDGLAVVWVNGDEIGKRAADIASLFGGLATSIPGLSASAGSGVFVVRAEASGLAFVGHQSGGPAPTQRPGRPRLLEGAPATVLGGLSIFDLGGSIKQFAAAAAGAGGQDPLAAASGILKVVGLDLEKDVLAWLGGEVSIVGTPLLEFGVIADVTDEAAYGRTVAVLPALAPGLGGTFTKDAHGFTVDSQGRGAFSARKAKGKVALGFAQSPTAARALAQQLLAGGGPTLGDSPAYRAAFGPTSGSTVFQVFLNLTALRPFLASLGDVSILESFETAAARVTLSNGGSDIRFVMTLADQ